MAVVVYIHGFLSSPQSSKAQTTQRWLAEHHPDITFMCPKLSAYPSLAYDTLNSLLSHLNHDQGPVYLLGSSLGGFWATHFVEVGLAERAVLINPATAPHVRFADFVGQTFSNYYDDEQYELREGDIQDLKAWDVAQPSKTSDYWVLLQTGDETLDYRWAKDRYRDCHLWIEEGGNHSFQGYEAHLSKVMDFFLDSQLPPSSPGEGQR